MELHGWDGAVKPFPSWAYPLHPSPTSQARATTKIKYTGVIVSTDCPKSCVLSCCMVLWCLLFFLRGYLAPKSIH